METGHPTFLGGHCDPYSSVGTRLYCDYMPCDSEKDVKTKANLMLNIPISYTAASGKIGFLNGERGPE
jgi:hypothetical protein